MAAAGEGREEIEVHGDEEAQVQEINEGEAPPDFFPEPWPESEPQGAPSQETPEVHERNRFDAQGERCEVGQIPRPAQISVHLERKVLRLTPSDRNWISTIKEIFTEGRST
jgi:hypothetical protein